MKDQIFLAENALLDQVGLISKDIRLDIGIRQDCPQCRNLAVNAMKIAARNPRIKIYLHDLGRTANYAERTANKGSVSAFTVPFVMVNKRYIFFGNRSPRQLLCMIAEVLCESSKT